MHFLENCSENILRFILTLANTAQKMKFSIKDFFNKCDQIRGFLRIWSHLLNKFLMENFDFCAVKLQGYKLNHFMSLVSFFTLCKNKKIFGFRMFTGGIERDCQNKSLREKFPYLEFFWSIFSPNAGKYGPGNIRIRTSFHAVNGLMRN